MPLSFDINLEDFASEITAEQHSGMNLQASEEGRLIRSNLRDLREEARRLERRADEGDESEGGWAAARSIWTQLRDQSLEVLLKQSKDLDVAALLAEAACRTDGFAGLKASFEAIGVLIEAYWDDLYPIPDPEDGVTDSNLIVEERVLPLQRLAGVESEGLLVPGILHIPLTAGRSDECYGLCHWRSSRELVGEDSEEKIQLAVDRGAVSPTQFEQVVAETDLGQITTTYQELLAAKETWEMLTTVLSEISEGVAVVPASQIRDLFEECIDAIKTFAPAAIPQDTSANSDGQKVSVDGQEEGEGESGGLYPTNREDAFQRLERIADYFEKHDPHSLVAAQIRNIVKLGRLPRGEYYKQLLRDETALGLLFRAAGMDDQIQDSGDGY